MTTAQNHEWDVFVSHNGKQKPWARELVRQLRDLNLQVFFDEDDISTGEDITLKLEYALDHCRCVALVLSKSALDSSWVAMERATAIIDDPSSQTPRLLPIMIEPIDRDEIPRTLRRLKYADLTNSDSQQRVANYHRFLKDLGVNAQQLPEPPEWNFVVTPNHSGDESLSGDPLNVPGRLATESSSGSVAIDVREGFIELTIDEDFASFDENRQRLLTDKIRSALSVGNVKIIQAKKGSVVLVLRFEDSTDADTVVSAANSGALQSLNVVSASRIAAPVDFARPAPVSIPAPAAPTGADARNTKPAALDAETEAEIEAAMADLTEAGAAEGSNKKIRGPREVRGGREHRTGTVVSVGASDVFVEFGPKELGVVEVAHFKDGLPTVADQLEVVVQRYDANESLFVCVLPGSIQKADWEMLQVGQTVEARVSGVNKGGLELEIASHRAFMPASQVDVNRIPDLSIFVGEKLTCTVQKIDRRGSGNIVLSRRDILQAERAKAAESLREALKEGDTIEGVVRKVMDFGAFVDLGGVDGLIHLNDLSHERVNHGEKNVAKFVTEGKKVSVQVLKLDWDANRISLGLKQLQADPFKAAASEIVEGAQLTGKVTKCLDFGAFVEVAPGVEGLVHISELDWRRVASVDEVVKQDEVVQVKVLKIDPDTRKISLSIKQTKEAPQRQGGGGRGRGKRGDRDDRTAEEILKETPALRRMREQAKQRDKAKSDKDTGGLGQAGGLGIGLGDLKL